MKEQEGGKEGTSALNQRVLTFVIIRLRLRPEQDAVPVGSHGRAL